MVLIPSGPMVVDDFAYRIASFVSAGVKDGVPVNGSLWNCRLSCFGLIAGQTHWWWCELMAEFIGNHLGV